MGPKKPPLSEASEHIHVYDEGESFRCIECGHELNKSLKEKIRSYSGLDEIG